ncbi:TetR/AcrR family transcriptional regulator [Saccharomonospora xinjiangensis]|uniref:TetR/AcrR family transcriptional regulator n=1 Tax=Saccharomonospora xinjiangensis TaxID=75294 RepID=UPI0035102D76
MTTRDVIVEAAGRILRTRGYAHATTKEIAREAGYSEATLYKYFTDKTEIFLSVLSSRLPGYETVLARINDHGADREVRDNLVDVAAVALAFYAENFPISMSLFSSADLLAAHRRRLGELGSDGPRRPLAGLARYLAAEQRRGRIRSGADPAAVAALLIGACFQQGFLSAFDGTSRSEEESRRDAERLVDTLLAGLTP